MVLVNSQKHSHPPLLLQSLLKHCVHVYDENNLEAPYNDTDVDRGATALHLAAETNQIESIGHLLQIGVSL